MPDQTALLLTGDEWDSLEAIAEHYIAATAWADAPEQRTSYLRAGEKQHILKLDARRVLCKRLIEANR